MISDQVFDFLGAKMSLHVVVCSTDIRHGPHFTGRSINLVLNVKGMEALKAIGLDRVVLDSLAVPMNSRVVRINNRVVHEQFPVDQVITERFNREPEILIDFFI
jgi:hypothetical protein